VNRKIIQTNQHCSFGKLLEKDLDKIKIWRNSQMNILRQTKKLTNIDQKEWWQKTQTDRHQKLFSIIKEDGKLIGYCGLTNIDFENKKAEISFVTQPSLTKNLSGYKEIFIETLNFLKNHAFKTLKFNKVFTETFANRAYHLQILEEFGFKKTGLHEDQVIINGNYYDSYIHSMINYQDDFNLAGKKVLVTGGAGVIGKELIKLLKKKKAIIRCVDLAPRPKELAGIDYWQLDLSQPNNQFLIQFDPEFIFHLAADFERSDESFEFWNSNFKNNILASHYLLEQIPKIPNFKKIVFTSSYLIYDKSLYSYKTSAQKLTESSPIDARNLCGLAKLQTEKDLSFLHEQLDRRFDYVCPRIFRVYGKGSRDIISRWVRSALRKQPLAVFSIENEFDYIHAFDVAQSLIQLAQSRKALGIVNLANGKKHAIKEVVKIIKKLIPGTKAKEINHQIAPEVSVADLSYLKSIIDFKPKFDLKKGIKNIISHEKKNLSN